MIIGCVSPFRIWCSLLFIFSVNLFFFSSLSWAEGLAVNCDKSSFFEKNSDWCESIRAEDSYRMEDKRLNKVYGYFMSELGEHQRVIWRDAQRKWLEFSKAHCSAVAGKVAASPAVRQWNYVDCLSEQTRVRTQQLLDHCESQVCRR